MEFMKMQNLQKNVVVAAGLPYVTDANVILKLVAITNTVVNAQKLLRNVPHNVPAYSTV